MKRTIYALSVLSTIVVFLSSCGTSHDQQESRQVFRFNELGDVTSLDPAMSGSFENNWAVNQIFNGLVEMDNELNVQPCIATRWNISDDGLTYTFTLRQDVYFHDDPQFPSGKGRKVTANDFVFSFQRLFNRRTSNAASLADIIDYEPMEEGQDGIMALSDSTLSIKLKRPFKPFLSILTMKYFSVVPSEVVKFYGDGFKSHPIGTGPFKLKTWLEDTRLDLERNPNYFKKDENGKSLPYLDFVSVSFIDDPDAAFLQFLAGDLDMLSGIDAVNKEKTMQADGQLKPEMASKYNLLSAEFLKTDYLGFNIDPNSELVKNNPLRLKLVRQAINYAINRENIVRFRRNNLGTPATSFIPPSMKAYDRSFLKGFTYDPDKARELLEMANYPGGKGLPTITLTTTGSYLDIAEEVRHQLNEIGIPTEIEIMMPGAFSSSVAEGKVMCFRKSWIGDYPDPENFMSLFYSNHFSPGGSNYTHFSHSEFDRLYERCLTEQSDSARSDLFLRMEQILVDEAPVVPLYYDQVVRLVQKRVTGMTIDPTNMINLERVKK